MPLELSLLGRPQIRIDGQLFAAINANKALALLYYLAANGQLTTRQTLAGLLWSDLAEDAARRNLRVELNRLRPTFDDHLIATRDTLAFNKEIPHTLDLEQFEACLRNPNPTIEQLKTAVDLYRGDFLEEFLVRDAALFEEWQGNERERLRQGVQRLTLRLVRLYLQNRQYDAAIAYVQRLLAREPWLEEAHQALMEIYARTGQRGKALAQYDLCTQALTNEFGVAPADETDDLYDRILAGEIGPELETERPATPIIVTPARPVAPPFQAPPPLLHFVGREQELTLFQTLIREATETRTHALVGMGGAGKSTLAGQLAHQLRQEFPDGVLWANVATSDPVDILGNWARALGYDFSALGDVENRAAALRGVLADKRVLLVLDDVRSVARTRPLLLGGALCTTLITTRDLDVASALNAQPHRLGELDHAASLRLLTRILTEERVAAEPEAAQAICELLQHLPLAVEITAQRLASRPRRRLSDMADRLRNVEERMELSISDRAVRTSFMVSWESLDIILRQVFSLLGVFAGRSFAAPALAHISGLDIYTAEDRLFALTALSLVSEEADDRYRQHPLLADFAREQLGENSLPRVDMALYYQRLAESNRTNYSALRPEWDNLMAGIQTAHQLQQWPLVLAYTDTLTQAWFVRARYSQARQGYTLARDAALAMENEPGLATVLLRIGQACVEQNDYAEANKTLHESLQIYERLEDVTGIAAVKYLLGRVAIEQGEYETARSLLQSSKQLREQLGDRVGVAAVLHQEALLAYRRGDLPEARLQGELALKMQEETDDQAGALPTLRLLADIEMEQKEYALANLHLNRALDLCNTLQDRGELAATYYSLAVVARLQESFEQAQQYVTHALELSQWMGNRQFQAMALYEQCVLSAKMGDGEAALATGLKGLALLRELQDNFNIPYMLRYLGHIHWEAGRYEEARAIWREALELALKQAHPLVEELQKLLNRP